MFSKCSCQHCNGHIEFDIIHVGVSVKCPHCFEQTTLSNPVIPLEDSKKEPTTEAQAKAGEKFGNIRLQEIVEEMARAIHIIGDATVNIKTLKETKKEVKKSVKKLTDIIDRRVRTIQYENRGAYSANTSAITQRLRRRAL